MIGFDYNKVKDPTFFKENVLPAHSAHIAYGDKREVFEQKNSLRMSLDGVWKFSYAQNYASAAPGFEAAEYDCTPWENIRVPAHIQMEGYDVPQYVNTQYPWDGKEDINPGDIPERLNPVASYVKYFEAPERMKGKQIRISFQGVESGMALWLNGNYVGYSEDSFTPSDFDLTPYMNEGENKLAVQVFKYTSSSWCEDQDFYRFSGIYRSVFLYAVPELHVEDIQIKTFFDGEDYSKSTFEMKTKLSGTGTIKVTLKDKETILFVKEINAENESFITEEITAPKLWSAEAPNLYQLEIEAYNESGEVVEYIEQAVGFRKFEMKENRMLLNGRRIVFKGVNRHDFSSISGRYVSYEELEKDIVLMKQNNINAVRTCHYPSDTAIYDLCDKYGLYMMAECNLESHGTWDAYIRKMADISYVVPNDKEDWKEMMLDRANSCYQRDKNHASVLFWSCGNEAYGGEVIFSMSELFRQLDDTRLVHYEGVFHDRRYNESSDVESRMYPKVAEIEEYLNSAPDVKPFVCCEYSHAMGNSCGSLFKYTQLADRENSGYQGGFIWDYVDQSIYKKDRYGKWFLAYGGDFGERPTDYSFSGNGIVYGGERNASPKMQEVKFTYQNLEIAIKEKEFEVWNKNLFVNADTFDCKVELLRNGTVMEQKHLAVSVEPESRKRFPMPFEIPDYEGEYAATVSFHLKQDMVWAKAGHEVAFGQAVIKNIVKSEKKSEKPYTLIRGKYNIGVRGAEFEALFSYLVGGLVSYRYAGKEMIEDIPKPNFWRAPVENDYGNNMPGRYAQWKIASMYLTHKEAGNAIDGLEGTVYMNPEVREEKDCVTLTYHYHLQTSPAAACQVEYRVYGDGRIETKLMYDPVKELGDMPEFGMLFKLNADYDRVEWYGNGPAETYEDRKEGAKLGIYRNRVMDNMAEYLVPQECGNKTGVRYAKVTDRKGRGILFTGDAMNFSALPYTPHEIENAKHSYELPQVHYTVVRVSAQQMGVGGDDSWGALPHPEYLLDASGKMEFSFAFQGI